MVEDIPTTYQLLSPLLDEWLKPTLSFVWSGSSLLLPSGRWDEVTINSLWTVSALQCLQHYSQLYSQSDKGYQFSQCPGLHYWEGKALVSNVEQGYAIDQHMITYISIDSRRREKKEFSFSLEMENNSLVLLHICSSL